MEETNETSGSRVEPDSHDESVSRRAGQDELIVAALAAGHSYAEAGQLAGCSARTIARRMSNPGFARLVADRRGEVVVSVTGRLTSLAAEAVEAIRSGLADESVRTRIAAGRLILDLTHKYRHGSDLEIDVAEIRAHLGMEDT